MCMEILATVCSAAGYKISMPTELVILPNRTGYPRETYGFVWHSVYVFYCTVFQFNFWDFRYASGLYNWKIPHLSRLDLLHSIEHACLVGEMFCIYVEGKKCEHSSVSVANIAHHLSAFQLLHISLPIVQHFSNKFTAGLIFTDNKYFVKYNT
jgi:hypothetical protein